MCHGVREVEVEGQLQVYFRSKRELTGFQREVESKIMQEQH